MRVICIIISTSECRWVTARVDNGTTAAIPSRHTPRHPAKLRPMQDQWDFVIAAYAVTALGSFGVLLYSWLRMRAAEARVDSLKDRD